MWLFVTYVGNIYFSHFILKLSPILIQLSGQFFVVVRLTLLSLLGLIQCFDSCLVFLFGLFGSCLKVTDVMKFTCLLSVLILVCIVAQVFCCPFFPSVFTWLYSMFWQLFWRPFGFLWSCLTNLTNEILLSSLSLNLLIFVQVYWCYWEEVGDHRVLFVIFGVWTLLCSYCKVTIHPEFCGCNMLCRRQYLWYFQNIPNFGEPYLSSLVHFQCV